MAHAVFRSFVDLLSSPRDCEKAVRKGAREIGAFER